MSLLTLCQGRIVWVEVDDLNGNKKRRAITSNDDIPAAEALAGVVCSHTSVHVQPRPADYIEIPHDPLGVCRTKLRKPTVAICRWAVQLAKSMLSALDEGDYGGVVPPGLLELIIEKTVNYPDK